MHNKVKKKSVASRAMATCLALLMVLSIAIPGTGVFAEEPETGDPAMTVESVVEGTESAGDTSSEWTVIDESGETEGDTGEGAVVTDPETGEGQLPDTPSEPFDDYVVIDTGEGEGYVEPATEPTREADTSDLTKIDFIYTKAGSALGLHGNLAKDVDAASDAIANLDGIETIVTDEAQSVEEFAEGVADEVINNRGISDEILRDADEAEEEEELPQAADGTSVDSLTVRWMTKDTEDNEDESLLYIRPGDDTKRNVRIRLTYALSGEFNYEPGDIVITVPAYIFQDRNGEDYGTMFIPYPEDPSTKNDFNWKLVDDTYVLTNTKRMSAATKGYIEFGIYDLVPHMLKDMEESAPFNAKIEVVTHSGTLIGSTSNSITAQFDTEARVASANKRQYATPQIVEASAIPEQFRVEGEEYYVVLSWYMWCYRYGNTMYTIDIDDSTSDTYDMSFWPNNIERWTYQTNEDGSRSAIMDDYMHTYGNGQSGYTYMKTVYPLSQFEPDVEYTFTNDVTYTLTEDDPAVGDDPQLVTTATSKATIKWHYSDPQWINPNGHYNVFKNGNDGANGTNGAYMTHYKVTPSDVRQYQDTLIGVRAPYGGRVEGYFGIYPAGLNALRRGENYDISYTINPVAYIMPWTYDPADPSDPNSARMISNYFKRSVTVYTTDTGLAYERSGSPMTPGVDFDYKSVQIKNFTLLTGVPQNINEDGTFIAQYAGDGTFKYSVDGDLSKRPDVYVEVQLNGSEDWTRVATVSWASGAQVATAENGASISGDDIMLPAGVTNVRSAVTTNRAGMYYDMRVTMSLKPTETMSALIESLFENNYTPETMIWNKTNMNVVWGEDAPLAGGDILSIDKEGYDSIRGYTTDISVMAEKNSEFHPATDNDPENKMLTVHYSAKVEERSFIADRTTYLEAREAGEILADEHGVWYDLLPKGMTPDMDSIRLRSGDRIIRAYTIGDYHGSGRTLLVVEAELAPIVATYRSGGIYYYEDAITIRFDAKYDYESAVDYGNTIHNVIAFKSGNAEFGSVDGYTGELGDLSSSNHVSTDRAFIDDAEKEYMKNLDPNCTTPSFVYAGINATLDYESAASVSLQKDVQTNRDGWWSSGIYEDNPEENKRIVYTGGIYQYRLRMQPNGDSQASNMVVYDSLENFVPGTYGGSDAIDTADAGGNVPQWRGSLISVDVSQLVERGCAPVVYYSMVNNLQIASDATISDTFVPVDENVDLTNDSVWVRADTYSGDMSEVHAIAIDMSKTTSGDVFTLDEMEAVSIIVNMRAPSGEAAETYISQKGAWGDSANAYNNVYLKATITDKSTGVDDSTNEYIRKDYTKVGLADYAITVNKIWDDNDNRDGVRPETVTYRLVANGEPTDITVVGYAEPEDETLEPYQAVFENIPYCDENGDPIIYSVVEEVPEGYEASYSPIKNLAMTVTNKHEPEKINIEGIKQWIGDEGHEDNRPSSIGVLLYANGVYKQKQTIRPDENGDWMYSFTNLYKYENGEEIEYTVKESVTGTEMKSYISSVDEDGRTIINTYHPFGEMYVTKTVTDVTEASADVEFDFTFTFVRGTGDDAMPIEDEMPYVITEKQSVPVVDEETGEALIDEETGEAVTELQDVVVSEGTVKCDDVVKLKGGQEMHITEIPQYVNYVVTETPADGFTAVRESFDGTIEPSGISRADFVNKYAASGRFQLNAEKQLDNRKLITYQFKFELGEFIYDEEGNVVDYQPVRTASSGRPTSVTYVDPEAEEGPIDHSNADVTFGSITYTQADVGEHTYYLYEQNTGKDGYIYDESIYRVDVTVTDLANGKLDVQYTVKKLVAEDDEGNPLESWQIYDMLWNGEEVPMEDVENNKPFFENSYEATGSISLRAWKNLVGRKLKDREFQFELLDEEGKPYSGSIVVMEYDPDLDYEVPVKKDISYRTYNNANGVAVFPDLVFDQSDVGNTYYFGVHEIAGNDPTVKYDDTVYGYYITVRDNGDGTLSFEQGYATPTYESSECENCDENSRMVDLKFYDAYKSWNYSTQSYSYDAEVEPTAEQQAAIDAFMAAVEEAHVDYNYTQLQTEESGKHDGSTLYVTTNHYEMQNVPAEVLAAYNAVMDVYELSHADEHSTIYYDDVEAWDSWDEYGNYVWKTMGHRCGTCGGGGVLYEITDWSTEETELPVFVNRLAPGDLAVEKFVINPDEADPTHEFTFKVVLVGDEVTDDLITEYEISAAGESHWVDPDAPEEPAEPSEPNPDNHDEP